MPGVESEPRIAPRENRAEPHLAAGENRVVLRDVGWQGYETLLALIGDQPVRITYDRGDAELMSPLPKHERSKSRLGRMVEILTEELEIPMIAMGSSTLKREDLDRGLEADESFYIANLHRIRDVEELDMTADPPPDLAIEIEITRSAFSRIGIYGSLGVPEIWRYDGEKLKILHRATDGSYSVADRSESLPWISISELERFAGENVGDDTQWARSFRRWVRETVVPRFQAERGGK